jgi:sulfur-carrier protein
MAQVRVTSWLREMMPEDAIAVEGSTVGDALAAMFSTVPQMRSYVLDDRGALRKHVCVFADGARLPRDATMNHPIGPDSEIYVMQALSGG